MAKMRVKTLDNNQTVIRNKKCKITDTGNQVILIQGSKGRSKATETAKFTHEHIIKEPKTGFLNRLKFWKPNLIQYGFVKNKQFINFATETVPELDEEAINESTGKKILTQLGSDPTQPDIIKWISVALNAFILVLLISGRM